MIRGAPSHVDLTVSDMRRAMDFYDRVLGRLGYARRDDLGGGAPCWVINDDAGGAFGIALQIADPGAPPHDRRHPGIHHLAFHLDSRAEVDAFHAFAVAEDLAILDAPAEYDYTPGYYAAFVADPDGIKLEVVFEPAQRGRA